MNKELYSALSPERIYIDTWEILFRKLAAEFDERINNLSWGKNVLSRTFDVYLNDKHHNPLYVFAMPEIYLLDAKYYDIPAYCVNQFDEFVLKNNTLKKEDFPKFKDAYEQEQQVKKQLWEKGTYSVDINIDKIKKDNEGLA